jgi:hypothetical protein
MNQAKPERTSVKPASAIKTPKAIDIANDDFSAGQELFPLNAGGLCSLTAHLFRHTGSCSQYLSCRFPGPPLEPCDPLHGHCERKQKKHVKIGIRVVHSKEHNPCAYTSKAEERTPWSELIQSESTDAKR